MKSIFFNSKPTIPLEADVLSEEEQFLQILSEAPEDEDMEDSDDEETDELDDNSEDEDMEDSDDEETDDESEATEDEGVKELDSTEYTKLQDLFSLFSDLQNNIKSLLTLSYNINSDNTELLNHIQRTLSETSNKIDIVINQNFKVEEYRKKLLVYTSIKGSVDTIIDILKIMKTENTKKS